MIDMKKTGERIQRERKKLHLTQEKFAQKIYVTRQAVSKWECGHSIPDYESLIYINNLFQIEINEIIVEKPNPLL